MQTTCRHFLYCLSERLGDPSYGDFYDDFLQNQWSMQPNHRVCHGMEKLFHRYNYDDLWTMLLLPLLTVKEKLNVNSIDLRGSTGGTHDSIKEVIQMMADGTVKLDIEETTLDKVPERLDRLHEGGVDGRLVMVNK